MKKPVIDVDIINYVRYAFSFLEGEWDYIKAEGYHYNEINHYLETQYARSNYIFIYASEMFQKRIEIARLKTGSIRRGV